MSVRPVAAEEACEIGFRFRVVGQCFTHGRVQTTAFQSRHPEGSLLYKQGLDKRSSKLMMYLPPVFVCELLTAAVALPEPYFADMHENKTMQIVALSRPACDGMLTRTNIDKPETRGAASFEPMPQWSKAEPRWPLAISC